MSRGRVVAAGSRRSEEEVGDLPGAERAVVAPVEHQQVGAEQADRDRLGPRAAPAIQGRRPGRVLGAHHEDVGRRRPRRATGRSCRP